MPWPALLASLDAAHRTIRFLPARPLPHFQSTPDLDASATTVVLVVPAPAEETT
ncbi:MAG: hypothetical protein ACRDTC_19240 [Pseudonocardiaceae bacterium]